MAAAHRLLVNAFEIMRADRVGGGGGGGGSDALGVGAGSGGGGVGADGGVELLDTLIEALQRAADDPPRELKGVPDAFLADLDRVPKEKLKKDEKCPICGIEFLDGEFPKREGDYR